jgi:hypothetical protein
MQAERHEVVHHVVFGRDRIEDAAHAPSLCPLVDGLVAEMSVSHGSGQA